MREEQRLGNQEETQSGVVGRAVLEVFNGFVLFLNKRWGLEVNNSHEEESSGRHVCGSPIWKCETRGSSLFGSAVLQPQPWNIPPVGLCYSWGRGFIQAICSGPGILTGSHTPSYSWACVLIVSICCLVLRCCLAAHKLALSLQPQQDRSSHPNPPHLPPNWASPKINYTHPSHT